MDQTLLQHFNLPNKTLAVFGLWHNDEVSKFIRLLGFLSPLCFFLLNIILPMVNLFMSEMFHDEAMYYIAMYFGPAFKTVIFYFRIKSFKSLIEKLKNLLKFTQDEKNVERIKLRKHVRVMVRLFIVFIGSIIFSASTDISIPFLERRLPYKTWIPYEHEIIDEKSLWILSVLQILVAMIFATIAVSIEILPIFFISMAATMLSELSDQMKNLDRSQSADKKYLQLVECVKVHKKIADFIKEIENNFSVLFFVQGFFSSAFICLIALVLSAVNILFVVRAFL